MGDVEHFALLTLITAAAVVTAVLSNRISDRIRVPAPAIFLLAAAVASDVVPALGDVSVTNVQRVVTVMHPVEPEPWSLGVRFRHEPRGLRRHLVAPGSPADGSTIGDLALEEDVWIGFVIRDGQLVPVHGSTVLRAGDEILALADLERTHDLAPLFTGGQDPRDGAAL